MVLMAGMLPGVECARRRRLRQGGSSAEATCGTRRPSFCLYANGHDHAHLSSSGSKQRSSRVCEETTTHAWTLDSNAREAKERLDQKLRSQRESVVKRRHSTGSLRLPAKPHHATSTSDGDHSAAATARETTTAAAAAAGVMQREVFSKKGAGRRFGWGRLGRKAAAPAAEQPECAVCLEEFRAGDVLALLPCGHRFHWSCAVPWVQAASRCPFCRAAAHHQSTSTSSSSPN